MIVSPIEHPAVYPTLLNGHAPGYRNGTSAAGPADPVDAYLSQLAATLAAISREAIWAAVEILLEAGQTGRRIYLIGNGGSAATASHMANDLNKQARVPGRPRFRAIALTDNVPLITAWGNDADYAECFAQQLVNLIEADDVVLAISTSGRSPNILRALELAREAGARSIGFTGRDGGALAELVDCCIMVPSDNVGQQEDSHLALNHIISTAIRARLTVLP